MSTIAEELTRIQNAKAALATSIAAKGVEVPAATKIDGYSALVDQIAQGGGIEVATGDFTLATVSNTTPVMTHGLNASRVIVVIEMDSSPDNVVEMSLIKVITCVLTDIEKGYKAYYRLPASTAITEDVAYDIDTASNNHLGNGFIIGTPVSASSTTEVGIAAESSAFSSSIIYQDGNNLSVKSGRQFEAGVKYNWKIIKLA